MASPDDDAILALEQLRDWSGLGAIDDALKRIRGQPNFFATVPSVLRGEGVHSDMLAWLLTPGEWHGLGDRFAQAVVRQAAGACAVHLDGPLGIEAVHREFSTGRGPIDILVRGRDGSTPFLLGIENKIDSPESEGQMHKYGEGLCERYPQTNLFLVLLAPERREIDPRPRCPFSPLTYEAVITLLERVIAEAPPTGADGLRATGRVLASHYAATLRNHIMPQPNPEIDALCRELYEQHQLAWRAIRRRLPSERDEHMERLGQAMGGRLSREYGGEWLHVVRRDVYVRVFRVEWLALGSKEAPSIIGLSAEDRRQRAYPPLHFRLIVEPVESDVETNFLYALRLKLPDPSVSRQRARLADAMRALHDAVPRDKEHTLRVKSSSGLPPITEDGDVPDDVVDWFCRHMTPYVNVIDRCVTRARGGGV